MKGQEYCKGVSTYMSEDSDNKDGQVVLEDKNGKKIKLITIIGEIEGHDNLPAASKTTKYEHLLSWNWRWTYSALQYSLLR